MSLSPCFLFSAKTPKYDYHVYLSLLKNTKKKTLLQHTRTEIIVLCAFFFACSFCAQRCSVFGRFSHKNNDETTRLDVLLSSNCCAVRPLLRSYSVESSLGHGNRSCGDACMLYDECQAPARKNVYSRDRFGNSNTAHYYVPMGCMTLPKKGVVRVVIAHIATFCRMILQQCSIPGSFLQYQSIHS